MATPLVSLLGVEELIYDERFEKVCQDAGARAFVWKPRVTEDLLPAVQAVLAGDTFFLRD